MFIIYNTHKCLHKRFYAFSFSASISGMCYEQWLLTDSCGEILYVVYVQTFSCCLYTFTGL